MKNIHKKDFLISKSDLKRCKISSSDLDINLEANQVLLKVKQFALTTNNISYALVGDMMGYWNFFPTKDESWGNLPAWGFSEVIQSNHENLKIGDRLFGFVPASTHLLIEAKTIKPGIILDDSLHRSKFPSIYNQYQIFNSILYSSKIQLYWPIFYPLFLTAFLLEKSLADDAFFDADTVIVSSASSKTAISLAFAIQLLRNNHLQVIGLTSTANLDFVKNLECYQQVFSYESIFSLSKDLSAVYVDIAGNSILMNQIHHHLRKLKFCYMLGATHWKSWHGLKPNIKDDSKLKFFFAPDEFEERISKDGLQDFQKDFGDIWQKFLEKHNESIQIDIVTNDQMIKQIYTTALEGNLKPNYGCIISL